MDVRKPKLVRNWREFLKEYAIIVIGVLTALLAEQAVQSLEWHQKIDAAVADMNNELSAGDGPQAYSRIAIHDCVASRLDGLRSSIERGDRSTSHNLIANFWLPNRTWDSLAREAATASDVSAHLPHDRMLQYRIAYEMVPDMQRLAEKELADLGHLRALPATDGPLGTNEKLAELDAVEALKLDNDTFARESKFLLFRLRRMGLGLDRAFVERNIGAARAHYGNCVTSPHLGPATPGGAPASMPLD
jgi:hypothetical protein